MTISDGRHAGLNLGPLLGLSGSQVGLNLGVEWDDDLPVPVFRGVRQSATLCWEQAGQRRLMATIGWGSAEAMVNVVSVAWQDARAVRCAAAAGWGISPLLQMAARLPWRGEVASTSRRWLAGWSSLGQEAMSLGLAWRSDLRCVSPQISFSWRLLLRSVTQRRLHWQGASRSIAVGTEWPWRHSALFRRNARLPWGPAKQIPWGVRPKPDPDPEPEPGPQFPAGNQVGLNLGCPLVGGLALVPLNLGISACYMVRPQRRTYVVINTVSFVRLPDRTPIEVTRISLAASRGAWGWTFDFELADPGQLALLKPTAAGPRQFEITLNGYVWTGIVETFQKQREFAGGGVRLSGRSRTALLAAPYAPARVKASSEDRSMAQLVAEELAYTGFASDYQTVDWNVPAGAWFYDASTPLDAISALAEASGAVVQSHPAELTLTVRPAYPASPWLWRETAPDHVLQEDIVLTESLQMRSAPLYDAVVVTGELAGKGVTCKVRRAGEAGQLFALQASSPLINVAAAGAERGRNILCDRGEQAAVDLTVPLFAKPLKAGEVGLIMPLDLVQFVGSEGTWHGQCESLHIEVTIEQQAVVIEQTATLERHYTDAD